MILNKSWKEESNERNSTRESNKWKIVIRVSDRREILMVAIYLLFSEKEQVMDIRDGDGKREW